MVTFETRPNTEQSSNPQLMEWQDGSQADAYMQTGDRVVVDGGGPMDPSTHDPNLSMLITTESGKNYYVRGGNIIDVEATETSGKFQGQRLEDLTFGLGDITIGQKWNIPGLGETDPVRGVLVHRVEKIETVAKTGLSGTNLFEHTDRRMYNALNRAQPVAEPRQASAPEAEAKPEPPRQPRQKPAAPQPPRQGQPQTPRPRPEAPKPRPEAPKSQPKPETPRPRPQASRPRAEAPRSKPEAPRRNAESSTIPESFAGLSERRKGFSDKFIIDALNDELSIGGDKAHMIKLYMDRVPADASDKQFYSDPDKMSKFHDDLAKMIHHRLDVRHQGLDSSSVNALRIAQDQFSAKMARDMKTIKSYMRDLAVDQHGRLPRGAFEFHGFNLNFAGGQTMDVMSQHSRNIRANIYMQRTGFGTFVHRATEPYDRMRMTGNKPEIDHRIYLNPRIQDAVGIFDKIMTAAEERGLLMKGKILDQSFENLNNLREPSKSHSMRGDSIVLYAGDDSDAVLKLVKEVYEQHADAFRGRQISRTPMRVADGVAVGAEPTEEGTSLTSHRSGLITDTLNETRQRLGLSFGGRMSRGQQAQALRVFRNIFHRNAVANNVNPNNLAFNNRQAARRGAQRRQYARA